MNGHAQKAKELLDQANAELKLAAEAANHNKSKKQPRWLSVQKYPFFRINLRR